METISQLQLELTPEEREYLVGLLESARGDARAQVHHSRTHEFRDRMRHEAKLIEGLLAKLR